MIAMNEIEKIDFYGLPLSSFHISELEKFFNSRIKSGIKTSCFGYSLGSLARIKKYPIIYELTNNFDLLVSDGRWLYIVLKALNFPIKDELSIPNLVRFLIRLCNSNGYKLMLVGADKKTNNRANNYLMNNFSNIELAEGIDGYFENIDYITKKIQDEDPDVLLIGISSPKMEKLASYWMGKTTATIIVPCGGMIDVLGGKTKQTPNWLKKIGLASLYRLIQEPKRLFKRNMYIYYFLIFQFLPTLFFKHFFSKKDFSIPAYCGA